MKMSKKVLFVLVNMPFCFIGFIAAMIVAGYDVGTMIYEDMLDSLDE